MKVVIIIFFFLLSLKAYDKIQELIQYNEYLATLYKEAGKGLPGGKYNLEFKKLITYKNGSCSQQGYLLARRAKELGFNAQMLGLFAKSGANDVMVNVRVNNKTLLFIPSSGAYYNASLWDILSKKIDVRSYHANPIKKQIVNDSRNLFLNKVFFYHLKQIKFYSLNDYEVNLLNFAKSTSSENLFKAPYNEIHLIDKTYQFYAAGLNNKKKYSVTYFFDKPQTVYRFYFEWYSDRDFAKKIKVLINNKTKFSFANSHGTSSEYILHKSIKNVHTIKFIFSDFSGQQRLLLKKLGVY